MLTLTHLPRGAALPLLSVMLCSLWACGGGQGTDGAADTGKTAAVDSPGATRTKAAAPVLTPSRRYILVNALSGKCVDVAGANKADGGNIQQTACNNNLAQAFDFTETASGVFRLVNANSGKAMDVASASTADGANVQQWADNGSNAQRFELHRTQGNRFSLVNSGSGKCVDVASASLADGANIQQWTCNGSGAQQFFLVPFGPAGRGPLAIGQYTLSVENSGLCLDIPGASTADGTKAQQAACSSASSQRFEVTADGSGAYGLIDVLSSKALDVASMSTANGALIQQWAASSNANQRFALIADGSGFRVRAMHSGKCMDVANRSTAPGAAVQQWDCDGTSNQRWRFAAATELTAGRYTLKAAHSGKCLDVASASTADGGNVQQWTCNGSGAQAFDVSRDGDGFYRIANANSKKLVEVWGSDTSDGANVQQWSEAGGANQRFSLMPLSDGRFVVVARHSGKCVDVAGQFTADGTNVQQWTCNGQTNQQWALEASAWTPGGGTTSPTAAKRQRMLDWIAGISGKKAMVGIENKSASTNPTGDTDKITAITGRVSSFWGADFGFGSTDVNNRGTVIAEAKRQFAKGAMVALMYHACAPTRDEYCSWDDIGGAHPAKLSDTQFKDLTTPGTALNNAWLQRLDKLAVHFQDLKNAGVVVMFRPLHEMNQCAFWWACHKGPNGTARLYQITHDYLAKTKGLDNIIWVWNVQDFSNLATDVDAYNPGTAYFDLATLDIYNTGWTQTNYSTMQRVSGGKPIAVAECQFMPSSAMLAAQNKWAFVMLWPDFINDNKSSLPALYRADNVLTLDEMPGWH